MPRVWATERLYLRRLGPEHAGAVSDYGRRASEFHRPWDPDRPVDHWEHRVVARRLAEEADLARADRALILYLCEREAPDVVVGRVALNTIVRGPSQSCTVGYGLAPEATGRGLMTEALRFTVRIAFEELGLHRVEANVIPRNERSLAVASRCGFEREGFSPRFLRIAGRWEDHVRLARINAAMEAW